MHQQLEFWQKDIYQILLITPVKLKEILIKAEKHYELPILIMT